MDLQSQVARLEAENLKLKLELKVGEESEQKEREEKDRIISKLDEMVSNTFVVYNTGRYRPGRWLTPRLWWRST